MFLLTLSGTISETRVQVVDHFVEEVGWHLFALVVDQVDLNPPFALRKSLNLRWLVTVENKINAISLFIPIYHARKYSEGD